MAIIGWAKMIAETQKIGCEVSLGKYMYCVSMLLPFVGVRPQFLSDAWQLFL